MITDSNPGLVPQQRLPQDPDDVLSENVRHTLQQRLGQDPAQGRGIGLWRHLQYHRRRDLPQPLRRGDPLVSALVQSHP